MLTLVLSPARSQDDPHSIITIEHAGETIKLICLPHSREGKVRVGFDGPRSFNIVRASAVNKNPRPSSER